MKILIVGLSVRAMVESAVHSGYSVIALDAFGDQDLKAMAESYSLHRDLHVRYSPEGLYNASRRFAFDAVAYTSNLENHPDILRRFARSHPVLGNSPEAVGSVRNWANLFAGLKRAGFCVPETRLRCEDRNFSPERRWLVKPVLSGGGHGISLRGNRKSPGDQCMLQEFIPGKPCSASFVANGQESVLIGITEQLNGLRPFGARGFRYCGNILPLPEAQTQDTSKSILEQVRQLVAFLTREHGLKGVNGVDFILSEGQVYVTEVNPRYSASMELIERAYALPVFDLHAQAVLEEKLPNFKLDSALKNRMYFGKAIVFTERDAKVPEAGGWWGGARDLPAPGETLLKGSPICTVLASKPTYDEAFAELISRAAGIKEEIYARP